MGSHRANRYSRLSPAQKQKVGLASRAVRIRRDFGISAEEYEARKTAQGPICRACLKPMVEEKGNRGSSGSSPVLDHNHETGKLRDFIHRNCNVAIGFIKEDPVALRLLAEYLEKHNAR